MEATNQHPTLTGSEIPRTTPAGESTTAVSDYRKSPR